MRGNVLRNLMFIVVAVGDIACGSGDKVAEDICKQKETAELVAKLEPDAVLALGDLQYEKGSFEDFLKFYDVTWGKFKSKTYPVPGNHEYKTQNASGFFDYFQKPSNKSKKAMVHDKGYYSFDIGKWHLIALNSNCQEIGGCEGDSAQVRWLKNDLLQNETDCTLAFWHHPRYSSGPHGNTSSLQTIWKILYDSGVDVVLTAHDHDYERFAPQDANGKSDPRRGIREFVVGTGGRNRYDFKTIIQNSEIHDNTSYGLLKLTLKDKSYDWEFIPVKSSGFKDKGKSMCH